MIAAFAAVYLAIGLGLALARRARAVELLALVTCWPLYAPLSLERTSPAADRMRTLGAALDRAGQVGGVTRTAADAPAWIARLDGAAAALAALERAIAAHERDAPADSPSLARARAERQRRHDALAGIDRAFAELAAQVGLASWVDGVDAELARLLAAIDGALAIADPPAE